LSNEQERIIKTLSEALENLSADGLNRSIQDMLDLIDKKGQRAAMAELKKSNELKALEEEILARKDVKRKIDFIRVKVKQTLSRLSNLSNGVIPTDVELVFSLRTWWAQSADGKKIFVPLYELVRPERSENAVIGLIIHELRHKMYSLENKEREQAASSIGKKYKESWHKPWNVVEDVRIDHIEDPVLEGEKKFVQAMIDEFFLKPGKKYPKEKVLEFVQKRPARAFLSEIIGFGYRGNYSEHFEDYPDELKEAIRAITEGGENSILYQMTRSDKAVPDLKGIMEAIKLFVDERKNSAEYSLAVLIEKAIPIYEQLLEEQKEQIKKELKEKKAGEKGKEGKEQKPGEGEPGEDDLGDEGDSTEGEESVGIPDFDELDENEIQEILDSIPGGAKVYIVDKGKGDEGEDKPQPGEGQEGESTAGQEGEGKQGAEQGGKYSGELTPEELEAWAKKYKKAQEAVKEKRLKEMQNEPLNLILVEMSGLGKKLAKILIQLFKLPEEPYWEYASSGVNIDPIRYLLRDLMPFLEEIQLLGKPNIAIGLTVDASGSMIDKGLVPAIKKLLAIMMSSFQEIGKKKGEYSLNLTKENYETNQDVSIAFGERIKQGNLNEKFAKIVDVLEQRHNGIYLDQVLEGIIAKYKKVRKKNKLEFIFTDGEDRSGNLSYDSSGRPIPSEKLKALMIEAKRMGITIIGVGFNTRDTEIFEHFVQLDKSNAESIVEIVLKIAKKKSQGGKIPAGDLSKVFSGALRRAEANFRQTLERSKDSGPVTDPAMVSDTVKKEAFDKGGVDFTSGQLPLEVIGEERPAVIINPDQINNVIINGLTPVIINIETNVNIRMFLGLNAEPALQEDKKELTISKRLE
ncbi:MAG: VWA domain-containing protein, partial [Candidatus Omnitrophica bacterium]|nr:VWA domain-containing protein [Candidatus Omnitrophota bacterium]